MTPYEKLLIKRRELLKTSKTTRVRTMKALLNKLGGIKRETP